MCGRYSLYDDDDYFEIYNFLNELRKRFPAGQFKTGEIFPTMNVPVLVAARDDSRTYRPELYMWGFPGFDKSPVIINARSETAEQKRMFASPLQSHRCIVPSTGFFEWSGKPKSKYHFTSPEKGEGLYMAGICSKYDGILRFVILTKEANDVVAPIHDRMPVIIDKANIVTWLNDSTATNQLINLPSPEIVCTKVG